MLEKRCRQELKVVAEAYGKATEKSLSWISEEIYGKATIFRDFIAGKKTMTIHKFDEVMATFRRVWPPGVPWPGTGNDNGAS